MINNVWSVLCKNSVIDPESNNISIIEALEQVTATVQNIEPLKDRPNGQPILAAVDCELVVLWERDSIGNSEEFTTMFEFRDPEERVLLNSAPHPGKFKEGTRRYRVRNQIKGLPMTKNGIYHFEVKLKNGKDEKFITVSKVPLEITLKVGKAITGLSKN